MNTVDTLIYQTYFILPSRIEEMGKKYGSSKVVTYLKNIEEVKQDIQQSFNINSDMFNEQVLVAGLFHNDLEEMFAENGVDIYSNPLEIELYPVGDDEIIVIFDKKHSLSSKVINIFNKYNSSVEIATNINDIDFD